MERVTAYTRAYTRAYAYTRTRADAFTRRAEFLMFFGPFNGPFKDIRTAFGRAQDADDARRVAVGRGADQTSAAKTGRSRRSLMATAQFG